MSISNGELVSLIYKVQHSYILQVEASDLASVAPLLVEKGYEETSYEAFEILFTKYPQYQRLEFTGQHYTIVAEYFMQFLYRPYVFGFKSCYSCANQCDYFSLLQSADEFHVAEDQKKKAHSKTLSFLLYIAHLLPLACKSEEILEYIFLSEHRTDSWEDPPNFHADFTLNGWNDHIIQPARDAVLDYYKVRTLYPTYAVLALTPIQPNFIYSLNQRYAEPSDVEEYLCVNNLSQSFFLWLHTFDRFHIDALHAHAILIE